MSAVAEKLLTAEEYARIAANIDGPTELVRGRMVVTNLPHAAHGYWCIQIAPILKSYAKSHDLGRVVGDDAGAPTEHAPDTVRGADVAYYSHEASSRRSAAKGLLAGSRSGCRSLFENDRWKMLVKKAGGVSRSGSIEDRDPRTGETDRSRRLAGQ